MMKRVLVTGASGGIGMAIVEILAKEGYEITACYNKNAEPLKNLRASLGDACNSVSLLQMDVSDREQCRNVLGSDIQNNGVYYGIVSNAGICRDNAFPALTDEDWDKVINTNVNGFFNTVHPCIMPMCKARKPGRIVAISSVSGITGNRGQVNYSASKAAIIGAAKALAVELASRAITVNCVAPGIIETEMIKDAPLDIVLPHIPLGRIGKPIEVAATVSFLLSESASYITRQVISVNGGLA